MYGCTCYYLDQLVSATTISLRIKGTEWISKCPMHCRNQWQKSEFLSNKGLESQKKSLHFPLKMVRKKSEFLILESEFNSGSSARDIQAWNSSDKNIFLSLKFFYHNLDLNFLTKIVSRPAVFSTWCYLLISFPAFCQFVWKLPLSADWSLALLGLKME